MELFASTAASLFERKLLIFRMSQNFPKVWVFISNWVIQPCFVYVNWQLSKYLFDYSTFQQSDDWKIEINPCPHRRPWLLSILT